MELIVLGAGPAYTDVPGATGAAYLVRTVTTALLLDLGQGSFPRLAGTLEPSTLDAVLISHLHPDHFIDLVPLRHYLAFEFRPPRRVRVLGPAGLAERMDALHGTPGFTARTLDCEVLGRGGRTIGDLRVEARRVTHTEDSYAFRVAVGDEAGLVYSGDCGKAEDLAPLIRTGDTLLVEASFGPGPVAPGSQHLDAPAISALARVTAPARVLLTHVQMGVDRAATVAIVAAAVGPGAVELVEPGFTTRI